MKRGHTPRRLGLARYLAIAFLGTVLLLLLVGSAIATIPDDSESIVAWGWDGYGQATPPAGNDFVGVAAGGESSLALKSDGSLVAWGHNDNGQTDVPAGNDFVAIAAGAHHSLALKSDGSLVSMGGYPVPAGNDFVAIAAGGSHDLALKSDGSLVGWGGDGVGQADVPAGNDYVAIAAGYTHSLALKSDGSIVGWGDSSCGQADVPAGNDFVAIAAGYAYSLALRSDGTLVAWGYTLYGDATNVPAGNDFVAIAAGGFFGLALRSDGSVVGWGDNSSGQATPPAGNGFVAIAAGFGHSLALESNGAGEGTPNRIRVWFEPAQTYDTEGDAVANTSLEGYEDLRTSLTNSPDDSDQPVGGPSDQGGPLVRLLTTSTVVRTNQDYLVSGSVPGAEFTWGFPAVPEGGDVKTDVTLEGTVSFTPGFAVSRAADVTTFASAGGTQHLTLTVTPEEPMMNLNWSVDTQVGDSGNHTASVVSAEWVSEPPAPADPLQVDEQRVEVGITNPQVGFAYTIAVTINVASTVSGANIEYLPEIQVQDQHETASSTEPVVGSSLERTTAGATWNWQAQGDYEWTWQDVLSKVVNLRGHATSVNPLAMLHDLTTFITTPAVGVDPKIVTSLTADVNAALASLVKGNKNANKVAVNNLNALINHVNAQTGKKISAGAAAEIIRLANAITAALR